MNLTKAIGDSLHRTSIFADKHSPEILSGLGIAGFVIAGIWAVASTSKAIKAIDKKKEELQTEELGVVETVKTAGKYYVAPVGMAIVGASCVIGSTKESLKRNAALASMYAVSESTLRDYKEKIREEVGKTKAERIEGAVAEKQIKEIPMTKENTFNTGHGNTIFYEPLTGRYVISDIEYLRKKQNDLNKRILIENEIPVNEFHNEIGLTNTVFGEYFVFDVDHMIDIERPSQWRDTTDGTVIWKIVYGNEPVYRYGRY